MRMKTTRTQSPTIFRTLMRLVFCLHVHGCVGWFWSQSLVYTLHSAHGHGHHWSGIIPCLLFFFFFLAWKLYRKDILVHFVFGRIAPLSNYLIKFFLSNSSNVDSVNMLFERNWFYEINFIGSSATFSLFIWEIWLVKILYDGWNTMCLSSGLQHRDNLHRTCVLRDEKVKKKSVQSDMVIC